MNISNLIESGNQNTEAIGLFLYTDFFIVFQISGFLLLVAMIGAIVLAKNENLNTKSQKPQYQKSLDKKYYKAQVICNFLITLFYPQLSFL